MGVNSEDSLEQQFNMYTLILTSLLALATALPIKDTPEVAAARAEFSAAFAAAEKGEHAALAPVNTDVQAPAHVLPELAALAAAPSAFSYGVTALNAGYPYSLGLPNAGLPYAGLPHAGLPYNGLPAAGLPYAGHPYAGLPYTGLPLAGYPYAGLPVVAAPAEAKAEE